ncbi:extensin isoform X2 [Triticum aestivum]|uniref:extensin isoform X2 n=1 Tax=Triticum aestivum TaxID=4565 RepID=UPI001D023E64|nr:extensin-like isoform X2 [Triticum aestivum]
MKMNRQPSPTPRAHRPPPPVTSPGYLLSLPPPPSQWISPAPRPHLLRCSRRHLAPTYSAAPADASPPPSPQLPPAPGSPCGGCLPSANRPPPASDSSGIAPPPPSGCPRRRSSRHSASSPVGGPSPIRPAVQTHRPRPFTFATPLFSSHREMPRCSVQLLQPTRVIALFATTAAAQTRAWSSSNRFLTRPPRKPCSFQQGRGVQFDGHEPGFISFLICIAWSSGRSLFLLQAMPHPPIPAATRPFTASSTVRSLPTAKAVQRRSDEAGHQFKPNTETPCLAFELLFSQD